MKRRLTAVVALAAVGALASTGVALANNSTLSFKYCKANTNCLTNPGGGFTPGSLRVHWNTTYSAAADPPYVRTDRVRLYFDNNIAFNVNAAPKCNPAAISGNKTMQQAMAACGTKLIGTGTAQGNLTLNGGEANACVLVFNKTGSGVELFFRFEVNGTINCASPATNTNGQTSVLLQAPFANNPGATAPGGALNAAHYGPAALPFPRGRFLDFANISAASPIPLKDVNFRIRKADYVQARCTARGGLGPPVKKWVMRGVFNYVGGGVPVSQAVNSANGPPVGCA
jgi:hypothetical protein